MAAKNGISLFSLKQPQWIRIMVIASFLLKQQTIFPTFTKITLSPQLIDWTSVFGLISPVSLLVLVFIMTAIVLFQLGCLFLQKKHSILTIISQQILYILTLIMFTQYVRLYISTKILQESFPQTITMWIVSCGIIILTVLIVIRNLGLQIRNEKYNLLNYNFITWHYFALQLLKLVVCLVLPIWLQSRIILSLIVLVIAAWKLYIVWTDVVFEQVTLQFICFYGQIYSVFSSLKLIIFAIIQDQGIYSNGTKYLPLLLSLTVISLICYFTMFKPAIKLLSFQQQKYKRMISYHLTILKKPKPSNEELFYKHKLLIIKLLIHKSLNVNKEHDYCCKMSYEFNYLLNQYVEIQNQRVKQEDNNSVRRIKRDLRTLSSSGQQNSAYQVKRKRIKNGILHTELSHSSRGQRSTSSHKTLRKVVSSVENKNNQVMELPQAMDPSISSAEELENYSNQNSGKIEPSSDKSSLNSINRHQKDKQTTQSEFSDLLHKSIETKDSKQLNAKTSNNQKINPASQINISIQQSEQVRNLWRIMLADFQEPSQKISLQTRSNRLKFIKIEKAFPGTIAFALIKTNANQQNISHSLYALYQTYQGDNTVDKLHQMRVRKNQHSYLSNYLADIQFTINHEKLMQKIAFEQFLTPQKRLSRRLNQESWQEQILKNKKNSKQCLFNKNNTSCLQLRRQFPVYEPCYNEFMSQHIFLEQIKGQLQKYAQFLKENWLFSPQQLIQGDLGDKLKRYYQKSYFIKRRLQQIITQSEDQEMFFQRELMALVMIFRRFIENRSKTDMMMVHQTKRNKKSIFSERKYDQQLIFKQLSEKNLCICSGLKQKGFIIKKNAQFRATFDHVPINFHQAKSLSSKSLLQKTLQSSKSSSPVRHENIYSISNQPYPSSNRNPTTGNTDQHINSLLLLPFQQLHYQIISQEDLFRSIKFHNFNSKDEKEKGMYVSDSTGHRHYEVRDIKIYMTFLALNDIYLIVEMGNIQQLQYLEIERFIDNQVSYQEENGQQTSCSSPKERQKQLLYRFVTPLLFKSLQKLENLKNKDSKHNFNIENTIPSKILKKTLLNHIQTLTHNNYLQQNIIVTKSFKQEKPLSQNSENSHLHDSAIKKHSQQIRAADLQTFPPRIEAKIRQSMIPSTDDGKSIFYFNLDSLLLLREVSTNLYIIFTFLGIIALLFFMTNVVGQSFGVSLQEFLDIKKTTDNEFILSAVYSPIDLMMERNINDYYKKGYLSQTQRAKYLTEVNHSMNLTKQLFQSARIQLSSYNPQHTSAFYTLLYQEYYNSPILQQKYSSPMSFYLTSAKEFFEYSQFIQYSKSYIYENKTQERLDFQTERYFTQALNSLNQYYENSMWHQTIITYLNTQKTNIQRLDSSMILLLILGYFLCVIVIFVNFYSIKQKIYNFLQLPLRANREFRQKCRKKLQVTSMLLLTVDRNANGLFLESIMEDQKRMDTYQQKNSMAKMEDDNRFDMGKKQNNKQSVLDDFISHKMGKQSKTLLHVKEIHKDYEQTMGPRINFMRQSCFQLSIYMLITVLMLIFCTFSFNSRNLVLQKFQTYQQGEEQFLKKMIYTFDMFKLLITKDYLSEKIGVQNMLEQYMESQKIVKELNYLQFLSQMANENEILKNNLLAAQLCSTQWKESNWFTNCLIPQSPIANATFIELASKSTYFIKQLELSKFSPNPNPQQDLNLTLAAYHKLWHLHKVGYQLLTITHESFSSYILSYEYDNLCEKLLGIIVFVIACGNVIYYLRIFAIWQEQIFSISTINQLTHASQEYKFYVNRAYRQNIQ